MSVSHLSRAQGDAPTPADRIRHLQDQARVLAAGHVGALITALAEVERLSREINAGGDAYRVGVREQCRVITDAARANRLTIVALMDRA